LHRLGKGFQELEEKRAEAKIAHIIVQIPLMESYDLQIRRNKVEKLVGMACCLARRAPGLPPRANAIWQSLWN